MRAHFGASARFHGKGRRQAETQRSRGIRDVRTARSMAGSAYPNSRAIDRGRARRQRARARASDAAVDLIPIRTQCAPTVVAFHVHLTVWNVTAGSQRFPDRHS